MKKGVLLLIFIALVLSSFAVPSDIWEVLAGLQLKARYNAKTELFYTEVIPTEEIKNLDGKWMKIKGFVASDMKGGFILSRYPNPYSLCNGLSSGPSLENCIAIKAKNKSVEIFEKPCTLKGRFELNTTNLFELPYILNEAECLDCEK